MPTPEFEWKTYTVPAPRSGARTLEAAGQAVVDIDLPDLSPWPGPLDKAKILLETAAEVEHQLLVQYLFAAFSLKTGGELTDPAQNDTVQGWSGTLHGIARQEMGHLMTVQNLLLAIGHPPNLEREDVPPRRDLYPFTLHLEPLTQRSLAKYVAAESPADATGIGDVLALADEAASGSVNHVGRIYELLAFVFSTREQVDAGGSGNVEWDEALQRIAVAAGTQNHDGSAWHLPDDAIDKATVDVQGQRGTWERGNRVHVISDRATALEAILDVAVEGEGSVDVPDSHFSRFLAMYRGEGATLPMPSSAAGEWVPARPVRTDPRPDETTEPRTRRWLELADLRYAMLLGAIEHHLRTTDEDDRATLHDWAIGDMFGLAAMAERLAGLPLGTGVAGLPFTMPTPLPLLDTEQARWDIHLSRITAAIVAIEVMQAADPADAADDVLTGLLSTLRDRSALVTGHPATPPATTTSFARDLLPLFRQIDIDHMNDQDLNLADYDVVRASAVSISDRLKRSGFGRMPPPPDPPWPAEQISLFDNWMSEGFPP